MKRNTVYGAFAPYYLITGLAARFNALVRCTHGREDRPLARANGGRPCGRKQRRAGRRFPFAVGREDGRDTSRWQRVGIFGDRSGIRRSPADSPIYLGDALAEVVLLLALERSTPDEESER